MREVSVLMGEGTLRPVNKQCDGFFQLGDRGYIFSWSRTPFRHP